MNGLIYALGVGVLVVAAIWLYSKLRWAYLVWRYPALRQAELEERASHLEQDACRARERANSAAQWEQARVRALNEKAALPEH